MRTKKLFLLTLVALCMSLFLACMMLTACEDNNPDKGGTTEVASITLDTSNAKTLYDLNEEFTTAGLLVKAVNADNTTAAVFADDCEISTPDMTTRGEKEVTVSYQGKEAKYTILVREFKGISVETSSVTKRFALNGTFAYNGLIVYAEYYDGVESAIVTDYTVEAPDLSSYGEKTVTVKYREKTAEYTVSVADAPSIATATLVENDGKAYFKITGVAQGFAAEQITLDIQEMFGGWEKKAITSTATIGADGAFEALGNITDSEFTAGSGNDYMIHILFAGESFDVVDIETRADQTLEVGDLTYQIKSEQWFGNNQSYFVILRASEDGNFEEKGSYNISSITLEKADDKVWFVIGGSYENYTQEELEALGFYFDLQENPFAITGGYDGLWVRHCDTGVVFNYGDNNTFTIKYDVTDLAVYAYTAHFGTGNAVGDARSNLNFNGTEQTLSLGDKDYRLSFGEEGFWGATGLTITSSVVKTAEVTGVKIENRDNRLYFVVSGTHENCKQADIGFDIQEAGGSWGTSQIQTTATIDGDTFTVAGDITDAVWLTNAYFSHLRIPGANIDIANVPGVEPVTVTIGTETYTLDTRDLFNNGSEVVSITMSSTSNYSFSITSATVENRAGKVYYVIGGTYEGYKQEHFAVDIQKTSGDWGTSVLEGAIVTLGEDGTFTVAQEVTGILEEGVVYISHLRVRGGQNDVINLGNTETKVVAAGKEYTCGARDLFDNGTVYVTISAAAAAE